MRRTKIVCTIGPKTCSYDALKQLAEGGMNVVRLNMSHGDHEWHENVIKHVRTLNEKGHFSLALMLDTKGPEIRSGDLEDPIPMKPGDAFTFTNRKEAHYQKSCTEVSYDGFIEEVKVGDKILVDGGMMSFEVQKKTEHDLMCEVVDGGILTSRRHLNVRGKSTLLSSITKKDWLDIDFGIEMGIDFIALSFVKEAEAIHELKKYLNQKKATIDVIAKIESAASIPSLEALLDAADGTMVARGDLGAEIPIEEVPLMQERIVQYCRKKGKPVIVATHLLESMIVHPAPTRAEVTDIAQAVRESADAIMLSGETASGNHPFKSLEVMHRVAMRMEESMLTNKKVNVEINEDTKEEIVMAASIVANNTKADALLVITRRGFMAGLLARCRPNSPIYAFTNTPHVRRRLNLYWGITPYRIEFSSDPEKTIQRAIAVLKEKNHVLPKGKVVVVSDILAGEELFETIQMRVIK